MTQTTGRTSADGIALVTDNPVPAPRAEEKTDAVATRGLRAISAEWHEVEVVALASRNVMHEVPHEHETLFDRPHDPSARARRFLLPLEVAHDVVVHHAELVFVLRSHSALPVEASLVHQERDYTLGLTRLMGDGVRLTGLMRTAYEPAPIIQPYQEWPATNRRMGRPRNLTTHPSIVARLHEIKVLEA